MRKGTLQLQGVFFWVIPVVDILSEMCDLINTHLLVL